MMVYGATTNDVERALAKANESYRGNLKFKTGPTESGKKRKKVHFTLSVNGTQPRNGAPASGSRRTQGGRRVAAACWHAHRDFMEALFDLRPEAVLVSCQARYEGRSGFERDYPETGYNNIGSQFEPLAYRDACDCRGEVTE